MVVSPKRVKSKRVKSKRKSKRIKTRIKTRQSRKNTRNKKKRRTKRTKNRKRRSRKNQKGGVPNQPCGTPGCTNYYYTPWGPAAVMYSKGWYDENRGRYFKDSDISGLFHGNPIDYTIIEPRSYMHML